MTRLRFNTANAIPWSAVGAAKSPIGEKNFYDCRKSSRSYGGHAERYASNRMFRGSHVELVRSQLKSASPAGTG